MTNDEKVEKLKSRIQTEELKGLNESLLPDLIDAAKFIIFEIEYPYGNFPDEVESRYEYLQIEIALELFSKMGAEGEIQHTENGISRTYTSADVSTNLLDRIVPYCGV